VPVTAAQKIRLIAMQRRQASGAGCWRRTELADLYRGRRRGEFLAAEGEVPVYGLAGADLNVTTGQDVAVGVSGGYEQGRLHPGRVLLDAVHLERVRAVRHRCGRG
jgi:hypothetical protein